MVKARKGEWVEVVVAWGEQVLAVRHLSVDELAAGRSFWLGDGAEPCDFVLSQDELGVKRFAFVDAVDGVPHVHVPGQRGVASVHAAGEALSSPWGDKETIALDRVQKAKIELGPLTFHVRLAPREEAPHTAFVERIDRPAFVSFLSTFGVAGALFGALAFAAPPLWASEDGEMTRERLLMIQQYLSASALREEKLEPARDGASENSSSGGGAATPERETRERPSAGTAGGPRRSEAPGPSRAEMLAEARTGGMIALLTQMPGAEPVAWGNVPSSGQLALADAGMFSSGLGETTGFGSLGIGEGVGGPGGTGYGISGIGDGLSGPGGPGGPSGRPGWGVGVGNESGGYKTKGGPKIRVPSVKTSGHMPPEVIQRVVRQNFGRMRMCYEQGLGRNPNLEGRVEVRFLIGSDGRVSSASAGSSSMPDGAVTSCVVSVFYAIGFPAPESGTVRVTYPISFTPS
jgi:hypothetical protein